ncbi:MAG TPA: inorganic diphosphatase [Solirubrobacterales bacterium]|nr:inorganic diphosphatase [Solirubrobacterales bacterium]
MTSERLLAVIEIPKGSRNKYEYDEDAQRIVLTRFVSSSTVYPTDYGYLPGYLGEDGDPLDCLVCVSEPTFPGCGIEVKPVALFKMRDEAGVDDKIICVPIHDPGWSAIEDLDDLPVQLRKEVEHFFYVYKDLEDKEVETDGWRDARAAREVMRSARERARG